MKEIVHLSTINDFPVGTLITIDESPVLEVVEREEDSHWCDENCFYNFKTCPNWRRNAILRCAGRERKDGKNTYLKEVDLEHSQYEELEPEGFFRLS